MTWLYRMRLAALGVAILGGTATADENVQPAGGPRAAPCPPVVTAPCPPNWVPVGPPGAAPQTPPGTAPLTPPPPDAATPPAIPSASSVQASASARGTGTGGTALPNVNGDLLGGGTIAGPLPVFVSRSSLRSQSRTSSGSSFDVRRSLSSSISSLSPDEYLRSVQSFGGSGGSSSGSPSSSSSSSSSESSFVAVGVFPEPGRTFDSSFAGLVSRLPQVERGAFKITENESPRPMTRFYTSYYYYDNVSKNVGGPATPRIFLHQEIFGGEYAFADNRASVGIRVPYNQVDSDEFYSNTSIGDLSFVGKAVIAEDAETGSLVSGGLVVTVPTGRRPFASTITGQTIRGSLIQPFVGLIRAGDRAYLQGFSSVVIPTESDDVLFLANDLQVGYFLMRDGDGFLSAVVPTIEGHLNTPLTNRGSKTDPVGFTDQFTILGGAQFLFRNRAGLGISSGAPLTGPRPFAFQLTVQFNVWF